MQKSEPEPDSKIQKSDSKDDEIMPRPDSALRKCCKSQKTRSQETFFSSGVTSHISHIAAYDKDWLQDEIRNAEAR